MISRAILKTREFAAETSGLPLQMMAAEIAEDETFVPVLGHRSLGLQAAFGRRLNAWPENIGLEQTATMLAWFL